MEKTLSELFGTMDKLVADFKQECEKVQEQIDAKKEGEWKKGDFLIAKDKTMKMIFDKTTTDSTFNTIFNDQKTYDFDWLINHFRKMTEAEKATFLEEMHAEGKDWDAEKLEVVDYVWKPKNGEKYWIVGAYGIFDVSWINSISDNEFLKVFNVFRTEELAQTALEAQLELRKTLKRF